MAKARLPLSFLPSFCPIACYKIGYFFFFEKGGSKINPFENQQVTDYLKLYSIYTVYIVYIYIMKAIIDTINGTELKREFIIQQDYFTTTFEKCQTFVKAKKTQIIVDGKLLVTLSGWNNSKIDILLNTLNSINSYNKKTNTFNL